MAVDPHVLDLIPAYVLGSLEEGEARQVEAHLLGCVICRLESGKYQHVADQIGRLTPPVEPPVGLRERLGQRVAASRPRAEKSAGRSAQAWADRFLPAWGIASLFLVLVLAGLTFFLWARVGSVQVQTSPGGMQAVALVPVDDSSRAAGFVIIGENGSNGAIVVDRLPPLAEGQKYQVWLIGESGRESGALFSTDEEAYGWARLHASHPLNEYGSIEITTEPVEGSPAPTGPVVLRASLSSR